MEEDDKELDLGLGLGLGHFNPKEEKLPTQTSIGISLDLSLPVQPNDQSGEIIGISKPCEMDEECENSYGRKKLRLNQEQSAILEECFKHHTTLTMGRKHELAAKLNLRPRQVEVWFQNRRARTKLKQIEVDCKLLKKYCENLNNENIRLRRELNELRSSCKFERLLSPFADKLPKAKKSIVTCPSCEKMTRGIKCDSSDKDN